MNKAETYKINKLAKLMIEVVYPEFVETLKNIGIGNYPIKLEEYNSYHLTTKGRIYFIDGEENEQTTFENIFEFKEDPQLEKIIEIENENKKWICK